MTADQAATIRKAQELLGKVAFDFGEVTGYEPSGIPGWIVVKFERGMAQMHVDDIIAIQSDVEGAPV